MRWMSSHASAAPAPQILPCAAGLRRGTELANPCGAYAIGLHFSICEDSEEDIYDVVAERTAIVRKGRRTRGIVVKDVGQQSLGDSD